METHIGGRRCTEAWKFINSVRSDNHTVNLQMTPVKQKEWEEYYKQLLTEHREEFMENKYQWKWKEFQ